MTIGLGVFARRRTKTLDEARVAVLFNAKLNSSDTQMFNVPRYTTPEVLLVTNLRPEVLQTWINRNVISLNLQNPGRGKRRLYSALDVVKLAIMRRTADLELALATGVEIAEDAAERLEKQGSFDWNYYLSFHPRNASAGDGINITNSEAEMAKLRSITGDPDNMRVSHFVETFESTFSRRDKPSLAKLREAKAKSGERPINPDKRYALARMGFHAEPVIIFPLGEIVNGTLVQLETLEEREGDE